MTSRKNRARILAIAAGMSILLYGGSPAYAEPSDSDGGSANSSESTDNDNDSDSDDDSDGDADDAGAGSESTDENADANTEPDASDTDTTGGPGVTPDTSENTDNTDPPPQPEPTPEPTTTNTVAPDTTSTPAGNGTPNGVPAPVGTPDIDVAGPPTPDHTQRPPSPDHDPQNDRTTARAVPGTPADRAGTPPVATGTPLAATATLAASETTPTITAPPPTTLAAATPLEPRTTALGFLALFGLPLLGGNGSAPASSPASWTLLWWVRRTQSLLDNKTPTAGDWTSHYDEESGTATGQIGVTDADGDRLVYSTPTTTTQGGTVVIDQATGNYTYKPSDALRESGGTDTFTVTASDESSFHIHGLAGLFGEDRHSTTTTITVTVPAANQPPTLTASPPSAPASFTGAVSGQLTFIDRDDDQPTYTVTGDDVTQDGDTYTSPKGTLVFNPANGEYVYTPTPEARAAADENTTDSFLVTADDGHGHSTSVTLNLPVKPIAKPVRPDLPGDAVGIPVQGSDGVIYQHSHDTETDQYWVNVVEPNGTVSSISLPASPFGNPNATATGGITQASHDESTGTYFLTVAEPGQQPVTVELSGQPVGAPTIVVHEGKTVIYQMTRSATESEPEPFAVMARGFALFAADAGDQTYSIDVVDGDGVVHTVELPGQPVGPLTVTPDGDARQVVSIFDDESGVTTAAVIVAHPDGTSDQIDLPGTTYGDPKFADDGTAYVVSTDENGAFSITTVDTGGAAHTVDLPGFLLGDVVVGPDGTASLVAGEGSGEEAEYYLIRVAPDGTDSDVLLPGNSGASAVSVDGNGSYATTVTYPTDGSGEYVTHVTGLLANGTSWTADIDGMIGNDRPYLSDGIGYQVTYAAVNNYLDTTSDITAIDLATGTATLVADDVPGGLATQYGEPPAVTASDGTTYWAFNNVDGDAAGTPLTADTTLVIVDRDGSAEVHTLRGLSYQDGGRVRFTTSGVPFLVTRDYSPQSQSLSGVNVISLENGVPTTTSLAASNPFVMGVTDDGTVILFDYDSETGVNTANFVRTDGTITTAVLPNRTDVSNYHGYILAPDGTVYLVFSTLNSPDTTINVITPTGGQQDLTVPGTYTAGAYSVSSVDSIYLTTAQDNGDGTFTPVITEISALSTNTPPVPVEGYAPTVDAADPESGSVSGNFSGFAVSTDGDALTYQITGATMIAPGVYTTRGGGTLLADPETGEFTYIPSLLARTDPSTTSDVFYVKADDGHGGFAAAAVVVPIEPLPQGTSVGSINSPELDAMTDPTLTTDDPDVTFNPYTHEYAYTPTWETRHAAALPGAVQSHTFTVTATDSVTGETFEIEVTAPITPANNAPSITVGAPEAPASDTGAVSGGLDFTDLDGDEMTFLIYSLDTGQYVEGTTFVGDHGILVLDPQTGRYTYTPTVDARYAASSEPLSERLLVGVNDGHGSGTSTELILPIDPIATTESVALGSVRSDESRYFTGEDGTVYRVDNDWDQETLTYFTNVTIVDPDGSVTSVNLPGMGATETVVIGDNGTAYYTTFDNYYFVGNGHLNIIKPDHTVVTMDVPGQAQFVVLGADGNAYQSAYDNSTQESTVTIVDQNGAVSTVTVPGRSGPIRPSNAASPVVVGADGTAYVTTQSFQSGDGYTTHVSVIAAGEDHATTISHAGIPIGNAVTTDSGFTYQIVRTDIGTTIIVVGASGSHRFVDLDGDPYLTAVDGNDGRVYQTTTIQNYGSPDGPTTVVTVFAPDGTVEQTVPIDGSTWGQVTVTPTAVYQTTVDGGYPDQTTTVTAVTANSPRDPITVDGTGNSPQIIDEDGTLLLVTHDPDGSGAWQTTVTTIRPDGTSTTRTFDGRFDGYVVAPDGALYLTRSNDNGSEAPSTTLMTVSPDGTLDEVELAGSKYDGPVVGGDNVFLVTQQPHAPSPVIVAVTPDGIYYTDLGQSPSWMLPGDDGSAYVLTLSYENGLATTQLHVIDPNGFTHHTLTVPGAPRTGPTFTEDGDVALTTYTADGIHTTTLTRH